MKGLEMFKKIFVPIDLAQQSSWKKALPVAVKMARENGAELAVFTVVPDLLMTLVGPFLPEDHQVNLMKEAESELKTLLEREIPDDIRALAYVRHGKRIYRQIIKAADELGADLIVLASHRPENKDYLLGPNAAQVVRHALQSVFVIR